MQAFFNKPELKQKYLDRVIAHREADNLVQGTGWSNGKGCAIGCTFEDYNHSKMRTEWDVPEALAYLEDRIFEGLPNDKAQVWPERFIKAIRVGSDHSKTHLKFLAWLLTESTMPRPEEAAGVIADCANAISAVIYATNSKEAARAVMDAMDAAEAVADRGGNAANAAYASVCTFAATGYAVIACAKAATAAARAADAKDVFFEEMADNLIRIMESE